VVAKSPAAAPASPKKPAAPKKAKPSKPQESATTASTPAENHNHISPEEAVAHIQALLKAKQDRVKQGPTWPGATSAPQGENGDLHGNAGKPSAEAVHNHVAHARGDQGKNGKS
jgi:hypothetical protein